MKTLVNYLNESKEDKTSIQIEKNNEKIEKFQTQIEKFRNQYNKILNNYKNKKEYHNLLPYEILANFKYVSPKEQYNLEQQIGKHLVYPYNNVAYDMICLITDKKIKNEIYWDYFIKLNELTEKMDSKQKSINEIVETNKKLSQKISGYIKTEDLIKELFAKIPQLKEFIDLCGEKQYDFLINKNEKLKKSWETYNEKEKEFNEKWQRHVGKEWRNAYSELRKFKPKQIVMTKEEIRKSVENWKKYEAVFLASRINTEFGAVINATLTIGVDGNVNGYITGTKKSAKIESIFAGGYNIQQLHTRMLIHEK